MAKASVEVRGRAMFDTAIGPCGVAWGAKGIVGILLPEATPEATRARLERVAPDARDGAVPATIRRAIEAMQRHLAGEPADLDSIALDLSGVPPFYRQVYEASRAIPSGKTLSYGEIAKQIGSPGSSRAVGQALGKNPFPLVIPCHRVLAAGKRPGGFSAPGGLQTKERMLAIEGFELVPQKSLSLFEGTAPTLAYDALEATRHLSAKDKRLAALIERVGAFRLQLDDVETTFGALAQSIVYQQLTGKAAATIFGRVKATCTPFDPKGVMGVPNEKLRAAGLSGSKLAALKDLAAKTLDGTVPSLHVIRELDDEAIIERLTQVRGIGRWSVEMLLIFRLGRPDVLPVGDYGVRKGFAQTFRKRELPTPKELAKFGEKWRPFRSVASWYLWRALDT